MWFNTFISIAGFQAATLYAEAETKTFHANDSDNTVTYLFLEEVKIYMKDVNNTKNYFQLDENSMAIHATIDKTEASLFTLTTTPELHQTGQFQIVYSPSIIAENMTSDSLSRHDALVMDNDRTKGQVSQAGPYRLVSNMDLYPALEIHGVSTTLPDFE